MTLDDMLSELDEAGAHAEAAADAIDAATTVENEVDFRANIVDALVAARALVAELERLSAL